MTRVRLLATAADPRDPTVVYGAGHEIDITDEATLTQLQNQGVVEVLDAAPPTEGVYNARTGRDDVAPLEPPKASKGGPQEKPEEKSEKKK
jgi:hypothetical protein